MRTPLEIETAFAPTNSLREDAPFYLVGIGGAGMSALAMMLKRRAIPVRGSDSTPSAAIDALERAGIEVSIGHEPPKFIGNEQLILSDAIVLDDSPEVAAARSGGLKLYRRSQLLGWLLKHHDVIAVTGTHGKTTTTAMLGAALKRAGLDPTIVVGAYVPEFGASVIEGQSNWAVVEACEAYDSFHDLNPKHILLTNLQLDHIDFHQTWERLLGSVIRFVRSLPDSGRLVYCADDAGASEVAANFTEKSDSYSGTDWEGTLATSGFHNRANAQGALTMALLAGASRGAAQSGIAEFGGAERRLQVLWDRDNPGLGIANSLTVVDDYAHHPTEVLASIEALRERYPNRRIAVVFQPHLYSRTAGLIPEFAQALSVADFVVLTDIYPAREDPLPGISSARIAELVTAPCRYVPSRRLLPREVARWVNPGDVVVGMGAGNISEFAPEFIEEIQRPSLADFESGQAKLNVVVCYGGDSAEREVSLLSGRAVKKGLELRGHTAMLLDFTDLLLTGADLRGLTGPKRPDAVFLAVHGTHAEDGAIQGFLEILGIPYTGSGIQSSAIAMDKVLTKRILESHGIRTPKTYSAEDITVIKTHFEPVVVKPNEQGSTVGLSFVESVNQLDAAIAKAKCYGGQVVIEAWITGMEISVPVLNGQALNAVEIVPKSGPYDFANKYVPGATDEIVPARLPEEKLREAQEIALRCHQILGCRGATRTDMIVDKSGCIFVLELNTLPGLTATSLLPNSARSMGISMDDLCERIVLEALRNDAKKA